VGVFVLDDEALRNQQSKLDVSELVPICEPLVG